MQLLIFSTFETNGIDFITCTRCGCGYLVGVVTLMGLCTAT